MPPIQRPLRSLAVLAAAAVILAGCGGTPAGSVRQRRAPLVSIFEAPLELPSAPAQTLARLRALGVDYVRVTVPWSSVAPAPSAAVEPGGFAASDPAAYPPAGWAPYDAIVRDAARTGVGVLLDPTAPAPRWATGQGAPPGSPSGVWKPSAAQFGGFVRALGTRYSGRYTPPGAGAPLPRVSFWSIWNEPNYGQDLAPQALGGNGPEIAPALYRGLIDAAWNALHASGHGADAILIGELAPRGQVGPQYPGDFAGMVPLRFVRALYCVGPSLQKLEGAAAAARQCPTGAGASNSFRAAHPALFAATGYAVHPYPQGIAPPDLVTPGEPDYADFAALPQLERLLDRVTAAYGSSTRFNLYSTEFGYFTNPPFLAGAPPARAAYLLNWAEYLSWRDGRIRSFDQYLLGDPHPGLSHFDTGLLSAAGAPKATLAAWRMPVFMPVTTASAGHTLELWGCVRPADYAFQDTHRSQRVQIQFSPGGTRRFSIIKSVTLANRSGYFDLALGLHASGTVRLAWSYPNGQMIFSRPVAVTIR